MKLSIYVTFTDSENELLKYIFLISQLRDACDAHETLNFFDKRAILCVKNHQMKNINNHLLNWMKNEIREYIFYNRIDQWELSEEMLFFMSNEMLLTLKLIALTSLILLFKINASIMLLQNFCSWEKLCNNICITILCMTFHTLIIYVLSDDHNDSVHFISRINLKIKMVNTSIFLIYKQFSIRFCFVMIINKSQKQILKIVNFNHWISTFSYDQLYVTLSRVIDVWNLLILLSNSNMNLC